MTETDGTFNVAEYTAILPSDDGWGSDYSGTYSVVDGSKVDDVTAARIARTDASWSEDGDCAETSLAALVELTDGSWAAVMAWCDTTGWGCRSDVQWKWAPTRELAISQGLDRESRARLNLSLPQDAQ